MPSSIHEPLADVDYATVRARLLARQETALLDLREEHPFAQAHPLWAANLPLSRIETEVWRRIPRRDTFIVLYGEDDRGDLVARAAAVLRRLGYVNLHRLIGGLEGWRAAGGELFRDVNVPSKAFGELVEHERGTPSLPAEDVQALLSARADVVVVDARRLDEYQTMNIPGSTSMPGAELVLRVRELAPDPTTRVIVNCAGRTRSIIGTQSLVNAGLPNPVAALRNGTIGWLLAGQTLEHGADRRWPTEIDPAHLAAARAGATAVAERAGVRSIAMTELAGLEAPGRTVYRFDVRTPTEYQAGHLPGFASAPGGQLVQETDHQVPVRGARIVLADDDGVRARMTGSWLAQMGWEIYVVAAAIKDFTEHGLPDESLPAPALAAESITAAALAARLGHADQPDAAAAIGSVVVIDVGPGLQYVRGHVPGAWFAVRAQLEQAMVPLPRAACYVLTDADGRLAAFAAADLRQWLDAQGRSDAVVRVLAGGNAGWAKAGLPLEHGESRLATPRTDRYRRPYEGTDAPRSAMQAYLDWEFGLVEQLGRDGTHHFRVV